MISADILGYLYVLNQNLNQFVLKYKEVQIGDTVYGFFIKKAIIINHFAFNCDMINL